MNDNWWMILAAYLIGRNSQQKTQNEAKKTESINYDPVYQVGLRMINWQFVGQCLLAAVVGALLALVFSYYKT